MFPQMYKPWITYMSRDLNQGNKDHRIDINYTNPGYGFSLVDTLWNAGSYRQPLEQEGNPMT